jgi:hypothetical protein
MRYRDGHHRLLKGNHIRRSTPVIANSSHRLLGLLGLIDDLVLGLLDLRDDLVLSVPDLLDDLVLRLLPETRDAVERALRRPLHAVQVDTISRALRVARRGVLGRVCRSNYNTMSISDR